MKRINKYIGDPRFLEILNKFIKAGYIDPKTGDLVKPERGTHLGGLISPLLCNIVLHELDKYMADTENKFSQEKTRKINPVYKSWAYKRFSSNDSVALQRLNLLRERRDTRSYLMADQNYRSLDYIRYADDFIVLVSGSFKDAKFIQNNIKDYIKANCGLELNQNKTVISNILKDEWSFLGAKMKKNFKINPEGCVKHVSGTKVGLAKLLVNSSIDNLLGILKKSGFVRQNKLGKFIPIAYTSIVNLTHYEIVSFYNDKIKGIIICDYLDSNRQTLASIFGLIKASCALTLARKLKLKTMRKVFRKFKGNLKCPDTDIELFCPTTLKLRIDFKDSDNLPEKVLLKAWAGKRTK